MNASIGCQCGKVQIEFISSKPRLSTECCCNHCFNRVQYLHSLGGPAVPTKPLLNSKWENKFNILSGRENLFVYKMTPETMVLNIASSCCHTFLLGRHSGYDANCVTTSSDFPTWKNAKLPFPASSRWFSNQWDTERLQKYPPLIGIWVNEKDGSIEGDSGWESVFQEHMEAIQKDIPTEATGETFENLVQSIGDDNIVIVNESSNQA